MSSISNISQLIAALRQKFSTAKSNAPALNGQHPHLSLQTSMRTNKNTKRSLDIKSLEQKLKARIAQSPLQSSDSFTASLHVFVETVLVWEFGEEVSQDPHFHQMLADVVDAVMQSGELKKEFSVLFDTMKFQE